MGCDVCYTNHAEADEDDSDTLLTLLAAAGINFIMGIPGADDVMLGYQSTSFHDALAMREVFARRPAPEFEAWLGAQGLLDPAGRIRPPTTAALPRPFRALLPTPASEPSPPARKQGEGLALTADAALPALTATTPARIFLPRTGPSLQTAPLVAFRLAQAKARDAVHADLAMPAATPEAIHVSSAATDRRDYLMRPRSRPHPRPGLGHPPGRTRRRLRPRHRPRRRPLPRCSRPLRPRPARRPAPQARRLVPRPPRHRERARVALGDAIALALRARAVLILIGERPGLSTPESLGAYLTWAPTSATTDADRNCISNIQPAGLPPEAAAHTIGFLLRGARTLGRTGILLKDDSAATLASRIS